MSFREARSVLQSHHARSYKIPCRCQQSRQVTDSEQAGGLEQAESEQLLQGKCRYCRHHSFFSGRHLTTSNTVLSRCFLA